jgi:hypothetical protein
VCRAVEHVNLKGIVVRLGCRGVAGLQCVVGGDAHGQSSKQPAPRLQLVQSQVLAHRLWTRPRNQFFNSNVS